MSSSGVRDVRKCRRGRIELTVVYLITFACYGTPILKVDSRRAAFEAELMDQAPFHLDQTRRNAVRETIGRCACIEAGVCLLLTCEAITCTRWSKQRFRRSE